MKTEVEVSGGTGIRKMEAHLSASAECIVCGKPFTTSLETTVCAGWGGIDACIEFTCPHCNTPYTGEI